MAQLDPNGLIMPCPACGRRNRIPFAQLHRPIRCGHCKTDMPPVSRPVNLEGQAEFDRLVAASSVPVLADFWAAWCGPCKMLAPQLDQVAAELAGELLVVKVDTERLPAVAARFQINSIPALIVFSQGREAARTAGARPAAAIKAFVAQATAAGQI